MQKSDIDFLIPKLLTVSFLTPVSMYLYPPFYVTGCAHTTSTSKINYAVQNTPTQGGGWDAETMHKFNDIKRKDKRGAERTYFA